MTGLDLALACAARGWRVFPVRIEPVEGTDKTKKTPLIKWGEGATTEEVEVRRLWRQFPDAAVGVATGQRSGLYVVDIDRVGAAEEAGFDLGAGKVVETNRSGGLHVYFAGPLDGGKVKNVAKDGLDFRGDGGFVVAWNEPPDGTLAPLPAPVAEWARGGATGRGDGAPAEPLADVIREGGREAAMVSLAGSMRRRGSSKAAIRAAIGAENAERCRPPLPDEDLDRIADSMMRYQAEGVPVDSAILAALSGRAPGFVVPAEVTQFTVATAAAEWLRRRARWDDGGRSWWQCEGGIWSAEREMSVRRTITEASVSCRPDASASWTAGVERYARELLAIDPATFDKEPWLLGVKGGVIDLRTGTLLDPDPDLLLTRAAPIEYDPDATCPTWIEHLLGLFGSEEKLRWFQKACGMALCADSVSKDQNFVYLLGPPGAGKGLALRAMGKALGLDQHAANLQARDFVSGGPQRHLAWMTKLRGIRVAMVEEVPTRQMNTSLLKTLTGGDPITANRMRKEDETWEPTHTLFMSANHALDIDGRDADAMRRRYRPISTGQKVDHGPGWEQRVLQELPGILAWMVEGTRLWIEDGCVLEQLPDMAREVDEHLEENDRWIEWAREALERIDCAHDSTKECPADCPRTSRAAVTSSVNRWRAGRGLPSLTEGDLRELYGWLREQGARDTKQYRENGTQVRGFTRIAVAPVVV